MSREKNDVGSAQAKAGDVRMPATVTFLRNSALDEVEKSEKANLSFLSGHNKRKRKPKKVPKSQGDWSSLEASVANEAADRPAVQDGQYVKQIPKQSDWHEIPEVRITPELEKDLRLIENRQHLDPKRFYKSSGSGRRKGELPTRVHVGTVVVGAHEYYSSRLTKRERRRTIMDEVMGDERVHQYTRSRFQKLQHARQIDKRVIDPAARRKHKSTRW